MKQIRDTHYAIFCCNCSKPITDEKYRELHKYWIDKRQNDINKEIK